MTVFGFRLTSLGQNRNPDCFKTSICESRYPLLLSSALSAFIFGVIGVHLRLIFGRRCTPIHADIKTLSWCAVRTLRSFTGLFLRKTKNCGQKTCPPLAMATRLSYLVVQDESRPRRTPYNDRKPKTVFKSGCIFLQIFVDKG